MSNTVPQSEHLARLLRDTNEVDARVKAVAERLDEAQLRWTPPDGAWGAGQIFEHLCISNDSYLVRLRALIARPNAPRAAADAVWKPSVMGGLLARSVSPQGTRKLSAPKIYRPPPQPRAHVVEEFLRQQEQLRELLTASAALDWRRIRLSSPVTPLIRLNLGDAFTVLVVHAQRHTGQLERLVARADFPASRAATVEGGPGSAPR